MVVTTKSSDAHLFSVESKNISAHMLLNEAHVVVTSLLTKRNSRMEMDKSVNSKFTDLHTLAALWLN